MKIYLATWNEDNQGKALNKIKSGTRLFSYFFLKDLGAFLKNYVNKANEEMGNAISNKEI